MNVEALRLRGAFQITPTTLADERGSFERTYCATQFEEMGLNANVAQCSVSCNRVAGTLRGMHYQAAPHEEAKLVRCQRGASYHVVLDLRRSSDTFCDWLGIELSANRRNSLYVPEGCAHGFLTLLPHTEIHYQISVAHTPESARGIRWDDPAFDIKWPMQVSVISERDATYAAFDPHSGRAA